MKKFSAKKGLLIFYGFDAVLILAVCFLLIPFNRKNSPDSIFSSFIDSDEEILEIRISSRNDNIRISMENIDGNWIGTDSNSNDILYWPCNVQYVEKILKLANEKKQWNKLSENVTSWKNFSVDNSHAVEFSFHSKSKTIGSIFFGNFNELENKISFRTSKNSTVWEVESDFSNFAYETSPSFWADPFIEPLCVLPRKKGDKDSGLRRGELVYLKPGENVKPFNVVKRFFENGSIGTYSFYEKDKDVIVIPTFYADEQFDLIYREYLKKISYRYSISRWTYDRFVKGDVDEEL